MKRTVVERLTVMYRVEQRKLRWQEKRLEIVQRREKGEIEKR